MKHDIDKVSPRPWRRGITYRDNPILRHWTTEDFDKNDEQERLRVFSNMSWTDFGKSRKLLFVIDPQNSPPEWAEHLEYALNCFNRHEQMLSVIKACHEYFSTGGYYSFKHECFVCPVCNKHSTKMDLENEIPHCTNPECVTFQVRAILEVVE